jgi:hypothetical protein
MEPLDLWKRYIEPKYHARCLRFEREPDGNYTLLLDGKRTPGPGEFTNRELRVPDIRRATRRQYSAEEKIRIVIAGLRSEDGNAELCRKEGINQNLYYRWSKDFQTKSCRDSTKF